MNADAVVAMAARAVAIVENFIVGSVGWFNTICYCCY